MTPLVFKTSEGLVRVLGGFDSHSPPPFFARSGHVKRSPLVRRPVADVPPTCHCLASAGCHEVARASRWTARASWSAFRTVGSARSTGRHVRSVQTAATVCPAPRVVAWSGFNSRRQSSLWQGGAAVLGRPRSFRRRSGSAGASPYLFKTASALSAPPNPCTTLPSPNLRTHNPSLPPTSPPPLLPSSL